MKNKKITSLLVAGALTVGIVGGTLAWLTASDTVTNKFKTAAVDGKQTIDIYENYVTQERALYPGQDIDKKVQVKNVSGVNSFIRVKEPTIVGEEGTKGITLHYNEEKIYKGIIDEKTDVDAFKGKWVLGNDNYYYYMGIVQTGKFTAQLLDHFSIAGENEDEIKMNGNYTIPVVADSVQSGTNKAYLDVWNKDKKLPENIQIALGKLEAAQTDASQDMLSNVNMTATDKNER